MELNKADTKPDMIKLGVRYGLCCLIAIALLVSVMAPFIAGFSAFFQQLTLNVNVSADAIVAGVTPGIATITDAEGKVIATLYDQERTPVSFEDISPDMIKAILSVEDRRFMQHDGVDWKSTIRAFLMNSISGTVRQGASTLDQQYVKNYQLLVSAKTDQERDAAIEETSARKLREAKLAVQLEQALIAKAKNNGASGQEARLSAKRQIVTRYLNLVYFGNEVYGVEEASLFYFGHHAKTLSITEAATLAGMVQSSAKYNPYVNPQAVLKRRNTVLDTLVSNFPDSAVLFKEAKEAPLGVVAHPRRLINGCASAHNSGFFCDFVIHYLLRQGFTMSRILDSSLKIRTTLDSDLQRRVIKKLHEIANPNLQSVAEVINILKPGSTSHDIMAMASSRIYGLNVAHNETELAEPYSLVGDGAGSVFKIFTAAAALNKGMGINAHLSVPGHLELKNMGHGGLKGCPPDSYCVKNDGKYGHSMDVTHALATSPNTAFVKLLYMTGVPETMDMAVRLGMRSYALPGTGSDGVLSIAQEVKDGNLGSFTLGPVPVNDLELSNVATTLASHGVWCPPNPIISVSEPIFDEYGAIQRDDYMKYKDISISKDACEQVVSPGLANTLSNALSKDASYGTASSSARRTGWTFPVSAKTGTTETHRSSAFVGYTNHYAGAVYIFGDMNPQQICTSPLRSCSDGNVYGGEEPAYTWFSIFTPIAEHWGQLALPQVDQKYVEGSPKGVVPSISELSSIEDIEDILTSAGFRYEILEVKSLKPKGTILGLDPTGVTVPGAVISINVSNGIPPKPPVEKRNKHHPPQPNPDDQNPNTHDNPWWWNP